MTNKAIFNRYLFIFQKKIDIYLFSQLT